MEENYGKVTIAPNVLVTIVQKTAASVPGVARLSENTPGVQRLLGLHTTAEGVRVSISEDRVAVDLFLIARRGFDLFLMGQQLQKEITRAVEDIVGMEVQEVNVHIEDIATELAHEQLDTREKVS
ncbi:MAG: Asp23/Gls24 family envelope stress response protein [Anaerolineae bacterium]|nr:Asp23/Gls24 family envelope stress response protein [Anaerolineae bacterium]